MTLFVGCNTYDQSLLTILYGQHIYLGPAHNHNYSHIKYHVQPIYNTDWMNYDVY